MLEPGPIKVLSRKLRIVRGVQDFPPEKESSCLSSKRQVETPDGTSTYSGNADQKIADKSETPMGRRQVKPSPIST